MAVVLQQKWFYSIGPRSPMVISGSETPSDDPTAKRKNKNWIIFSICGQCYQTFLEEM